MAVKLRSLQVVKIQYAFKLILKIYIHGSLVKFPSFDSRDNMRPESVTPMLQNISRCKVTKFKSIFITVTRHGNKKRYLQQPILFIALLV